MRWPIVFLSLLTVAAQDTQTPAAENEGVMLGAPSSFVVANQGNDGQLNLIEMVRPPETLENWSQTISVVTLSNNTTPLDEFYPSWRTGYRASCPGPKEIVVEGTVDAKRSLEAKLWCPRDPKTGKPESVAMIFIQGDVNLLMVEVAFRRSMTAADEALVHKILSSLKICDSRERAGCAVRRAFGFLPKG